MDAWLSDQFASTLAAAEADRAADAMAAAVAAYAMVSLADRFRAGTGLQVWVTTAAGPPEEAVGQIMRVVADAVLIGSDAGRQWVVPFAAVASARGLPSGHRPARGAADRLGIGHLLRLWCGRRVVVGALHCRSTGVLRRVGADHLEISSSDASILIPFAGLGWVSTAP